MTRTFIVAVASLLLVVPAALAAPPADKGKPESPGKSANAPGQQATKNAAKICKAERGTTPASIEAFNNKYGTNKNKRNAFGKCVSGQAKQLKTEDAEKQQASVNAAQQCKAERGTTPASIEAFNNKYGTNKNKANAFGKCVSALAKGEHSSS